MAKPTLSTRLASKSLNAAKSAIEIYNKPHFDYKSEAFVILIINAWELLFKALILRQSKNKLTAILIQEKQKTKAWGTPKRFYPKKNRAWNYLTIDIFLALKTLNSIDENLKKQIEVLVELRDNSIHFMNDPWLIENKLLEVATATTKSFVICYREWFPEIPLNESILPIWFQLAESLPLIVGKNPKEIENVLQYIQEQEINSVVSQHAIAFTTEIQLKRNLHSWPSVQVDKRNPSSLPIKVIDVDLIETKFKLDYEALKQRLKNRRRALVLNKKFHEIHRKVKENKELCLVRLLDPRNPKSAKKQFYTEQAVDFILEQIDP